jgi:acyl-CoA synthetase (AMP-forming)/AMP-acid ligase II
MRFLLDPPDLAGLDDALTAARAARDAGLDGVYLTATPQLPAPLIVAAAIAPAVDGLLIAAEVELGDRHPIELAEEAAVADLVAAGRLILVVAGADGETLDLLRHAFAARPFSFEGTRWRVPARLPHNEHNLEARVRVTPAPLQPRLELWTAGGEPDAQRALGPVADGAVSWGRAEAALGPALIGVPRGRRHVLDDDLVDALRDGRRQFGQDWALVRAPAADASRIGREIRPRVQLDRLPDGLEEHWRSPAPDTFAAVLRAAATAAPAREAFVLGDQRLSYRELQARVCRHARALLALGVEPGDAVAVLMPNCVDFVLALFGIAAIGATCVPINSRFRPREVAYVLGDAEARVVLTSDAASEHADHPARLQEALRETTGVRHAVLLGERAEPGMLGRVEFEALADGVPESALDARMASVDGGTPAAMLYTSGTTAMPKGCPLAHRQLLDVSRQLQVAFRAGAGDRLWDPLPLFHASGILPLLICVHARATFVSMSHFEPEHALELLEDATLAWPAYTTIWQPILTHHGFSPRRMPKLRHALCVGPPETLAVMEAEGVPLLSCYGITEGTGIPSFCDLDDPPELRLGTCGFPLDGFEVAVRDPETRAPLGPGHRGALWLRGRNVIAGYWRDPDKTAESFDADGWFDTGDLVSLDASGRLAFHGRIKDTLKVGGENVAAVEVEAFLSTHPAVKLAAVVGVPDDKYGEVPAAFVELRPGARSSEQELIAFARDGLAAFKVPRHVRFVTEWPMSATKIRKSELEV